MVAPSLVLLVVLALPASGECWLRMSVPPDVDTYVDGSFARTGPGDVARYCSDPPAGITVELYRGDQKIRELFVTPLPGSVTEIEEGVASYGAPAPDDDTTRGGAANALQMDRLALPQWWEDALLGHPMGQKLDGTQRRLAQFFAGACTGLSGCGVWSVYAMAIAAAVAAVIIAVVAVVVAIAAVIAGVAVLIGWALGGGGGVAPDCNGCGNGCGDLDCRGCCDWGGCCLSPLLPASLDRGSWLIMPLWLGMGLLDRGFDAMGDAISGTEPPPARPPPTPPESDLETDPEEADAPAVLLPTSLGFDY